VEIHPAPQLLRVGSVAILAGLVSLAVLLPSESNSSDLHLGRPAPSVTVMTPVSGTRVSGQVTVAGTATSRSAITSVVLALEGNTPARVSGRAQWTATLNTYLYPNGEHRLTASATDALGSTGHASITIMVHNGTSRSERPERRPGPSPTATPSTAPSPTPVGTPSPTSSPTPVPEPSPADGSGFVRTSGTGLTLDGNAYRFEGMNIYNVASNGGCVVAQDPNAALTAIGPSQNVFRFWAFQNFVVSNGTFDWAPFDNVLAAAAAHGDRVIMDLANEWDYCDGPAKDLSWYQSGYQTQIDPGDLVPYRQYVADVVARYADNPTVLMWELVNEAQAGGTGACPAAPAPFDALMSFGQNMGALVKSIDPNHLLSFGVQDDSCGTWASDYQSLNAIPTIDVCTYHDYGYPTSPLGNPSAPNLATAIQMCHADNKPIFVGEIGIDPATIAPATLSERAALFLGKLNAMTQQGVVGELLWDYVPDANGGGYEIGPGDPSLAVLGSY
jgi:mannan endo-1,4-beta-mannosidase